MITEDYVSFETAKLLKEKGFNERTIKCFSVDGKPLYIYSDTYREVEPANWNGMSCRDYADIGLRGWYGNISSPTIQMAMKWLREVHNLCIAPYAAAFRYGFTIDKADTGSNIGNEKTLSIPDYSEITTWEEACEAAIKYCLEHLI